MSGSHPGDTLTLNLFVLTLQIYLVLLSYYKVSGVGITQNLAVYLVFILNTLLLPFSSQS